LQEGRSPPLVHRWTACPASFFRNGAAAAADIEAGGVWLGSNRPQSISVTGFHYDSSTNTFSTTEWPYQLKISASKTCDLLQAIHTIGANAEIIEDIEQGD